MNLRRTAVGAALALALPLAACGGSDDAESGAWTFTDDKGTEISLDAVPERLVVQTSVAAALTDLGLGDRIVGVFGPLEGPDGGIDPQADGLDADSVEDVTGGGDYGDVNLEALAELEPDLIITSMYLEPQLWYVNEDVQSKLEDSYDLAVINFEGETLSGIFDNTERLAAALGADESDFEEGRAAFEQAGERLQGLVDDAGDPTFEAVSPDTDIMYVSNPDANPDLKYYRDELGLDLITPDESDLDEGGYWHSVSWENADTYDADVAIWDARGGEATLDAFKDQPVWNKVTAAEEDHYVPWHSVAPPSAQGYANVIERFADDLESLGLR
ncbi:ABC transporter substrate-binding protein [Aeromicrobium sp. CTD01-1L150]|uniref:ABC transporter substrate-binding protein n=1 Tax=Aeromicrobium sp. CTD01-1L150 TaxID=3341830 RepID=UPI0035BEE0ED